MTRVSKNLLTCCILILAIGFAIWRFYVPIAMRVCPESFSTQLFISASPGIAPQRLGDIANSVHAAVLGVASAGWNVVYPLGTHGTPIVWEFEVPCVRDSAVVERIKATLLSY